MLVYQPESELAETICLELLGSGSSGQIWSDFLFATAWVNQGGISFLKDSFSRFLSAGGRIGCTIGLDFAGTSEEALQTIIDLQNSHPGHLKSYVYKNDHPSSTFHPKVYLFLNEEKALLIVGSNNLTRAGLTTNVECSLGLLGNASDEPFTSADTRLRQWQTPEPDSLSDPPLIRPLTSKLLGELRAEGYVQTEIQRASQRAQERRSEGTRNRRLFATKALQSRFAPPQATASPQIRTKKAPKASQAKPLPANQAIFKVRGHRSTGTNHGTQIQVPKGLRFSPFMAPAQVIKSSHDEEPRDLRTSHRGGRPNYWYFEAPEVRGIPLDRRLLRLFWKHDELWYEALDASTAQGKKLLKALDDGRALTPPETFDSKPGHPGTQSWRFMA